MWLFRGSNTNYFMTILILDPASIAGRVDQDQRLPVKSEQGAEIIYWQLPDHNHP